MNDVGVNNQKSKTKLKKFEKRKVINNNNEIKLKHILKLSFDEENRKKIKISKILIISY